MLQIYFNTSKMQEYKQKLPDKQTSWEAVSENKHVFAKNHLKTRILEYKI